MKQATKNVCLALSDDEDYVSFDEEDLNAGIQDLYDNDSAEDAASDISNEEYFESNNNNNRNNMPEPQPIEPILHFPLPPTNITQPATATISNQSQHYPQYPVYAPPIPTTTTFSTNTNTNRSYNNNMRPQRSSSTIPSRNHRGSARGRGRGRGTGRGRGGGRGRGRGKARGRGGYHSNRNRNRSLNDLSQLSAFTACQQPHNIAQRRKINNNNNNNDLFESLNQINDPIPPQPLPQLPPFQNRNRQSLPQPMAPTLFADNRNFNLPQPMAPPPPPPMTRNNNNKQNKLSKRIQKLNEMKAKKKRRKDRKIIHKQKINTNVISIELGTLSQSASNIATGDPIKCANKKCLSVLSKYDKLLKKCDDIKLDDDDESIWICSFCNNINIIQIDAEEMPLNETIDYILEPAQENKQNDNQNESDQPHIIFCIDISGSMCVTQPVQGKKVNLKGDRLKKENDELSNFIDPMDRNQWMPNQSQNVTYISRLQSVQAAVDAQIEKLKTEQPALKVGLVTFNNEVTVYGDAMKDENNNGFEIITGDKLNNLEKLQDIGSCDNCKISHCVSDSHGALSDALWSLEEKGQTSLGPALTVSTSMASIKRGSQVILCTDGLANIGVGKIDDSTDTDTGAFYENLGNWAMEKGVVVSIISITDDGCNLEALGRIVEISGGNLRRINPLKLTEKFSGILDKEIIATLTNAKMLLHPGLKFVDTVSELQNVNPFENKPADIDKKQNAVVMDMDTDKKDTETEMNKARKLYSIPSSQQDVGNVFEDTTIFFEYGISRDVLKKDFNGLRHLPFQVHILYNKIDGRKMLRVITQLKQVTYDRRKVKDNLDYSVLSKYGTRVTTKLCDIGDYEASRAFTNANARYMHSNAQNLLQINNLANYVNNNIGLDYQMQQQQQQEVVNYNRNNSYHHNYSPSMNNLNNNWIARSEQITPNINSNNNNNNMRGQMNMNGMNNMNNTHYQQATPQQNIQQQQSRRSNRSDKFSSLNYGMKRKF